MPTLEQMAATGGADMGAVQSTRDDYLAYVEACTMAGTKPMTMEQWVKAGKPAGPK